MRLAQQDSTGKWVVFYNDQPIAISGQTQFDTRDDAVAQIATRGLLVKDDGDIYRPVEPVQFQAAEPVEAKPEAAPAPVEEPEEPEDDEIEVEPVSVEVQEAVAEVVATPVEATFKDADPEFIEMMAGKPEQEKIPEEPKGKRGRPRTYTPEEAAERRREQNRKYYHARKEARKAEVAARASTWWEEHPEKVTEYREKANEKRRSRYADDPEYRAKVSAYNREYQAKKRAERQAAKAAQQDTPPEA